MDYELDYLKKMHITLSKEKIEKLFDDKEKNVDTIIRSQMALVIFMVNQYYHSGHQLPELTSNALEGLYKAYRNYDKDKAKKGFSSFAGYQIRNALISLIKYKKTNEKDIIPQPLNKISDTKAYTFSDLYNDNDDRVFEDTIQETSEDYLPGNEKELIKLLRDNLKKEIWVEMIQDRYGIGREEMMIKEMVPKYNKSSQNLSYTINEIIKRMQTNPKLLSQLKEMYIND